MSQTAPTTPGSAPPPRPPSLKGAASSGLMWLILRTFANKGLTTVSQVVLAWLLDRSDFGLVALTFSVTEVIGRISQAGIRDVLIQRQARFRRWATPTFWMSATLAMVGMALTVAIAPLAAWFYDEPRVIGLLLVQALIFPAGSLGIVPDARLRAGLKFKLLAGLDVGKTIGVATLAITFAALDFGAYSYILPMPIMTALRSAVVWTLAKPPVRRRPQFRRWKFIVGDSATIVATLICFSLINQATSIVVGATLATELVGLYFFAHQLASQTILMFALNLKVVMFPVMSRVQGDLPRVTRMCLRAATAITAVLVPVTLLQAAIADPLIRLIFPDDKWTPAVPLIQVLSIGLGLRGLGMCGSSLLEARGLFRLRLYFIIGELVAIVPAIYLGVVFWGIMGAATAMSAFYLIAPVFMLALAVRDGIDHPLRRAVSSVGPGLAVGVLSAGPAYLAANLLPESPWPHLARLLVTLAVALPLMLWGTRRFNPEVWRELVRYAGKLRSMSGRRGA